MSEKKKFERLPSNVRPQLYDLSLKPNLNTFKYEGRQIVSLKILQPTDKVIFNSIDLEIDVVQLKLLPAGEPLIPEFNLSVKDETVTLLFPEVLPVGDAELTIQFTGELNDKLKGFYRGKYLKAAGEKEDYYAVTQFEPTDARRCFPCWDEPAIKAQFDVTLVVDPTKVALSNMPVEKEYKNSDGLKVVKFSRTPIMSTYLLAFVVGDFEYVEDTSSDGVLVRVYTPPGKKEQGRFALFVAVKVLPFYKEYFQIAYPLPKMDLIAIPDISAGAMENWGLVTYREKFILVDEANTSASTRQFVAIVVGHELAHQWFGNLVTMEWWTHLWLNEGYASFVEYLCVAYLFPEYDIWTQFVTDTYCHALERDALKNSHPIEVPVGHPSEIEEIFDDISYEKGASVIRMLHKFIGDDDFRKGMNLYLTRHQYGNTFTEDLWAALEEASSKPIKSVMRTWTKQMGYPVIAVESSVQENNSRTLVLSQHKFCADVNRSDDDSMWIVPLSFCKKSKPTEDCYSTVLSDRQATVTISDVAPDEWVKLNPNTVGFYRTKYPTELLKQFVPSIEDKSLPPLDRLGLVDDLFALIQVGQAKTSEILELIQSMKEEENYTVWSSIAGYLEKIHNLLLDTDFEPLFCAYGLNIMKPIYHKLGHENKSDEKHLTRLLRSLVLNRLVEFGDNDFAKVALEKFEKHCKGTEVIPADLRCVIYRAAISVDGKNAFNSLKNLFTATDMQEEKDRIFSAFTAVSDLALVDDVLKFSQSDEVSTNSSVVAITSVAASKVGRDRTWNFFKENYDTICKKYPGGFLLRRIVKHSTENFTSEKRAEDIDKFFSDKNIDSFKRTIQQSLETVRNNAAWLQRDEESIRSYLEKL